MQRFIAGRVMQLIITVVLLSVVTFYAVHLVPGTIVDVLIGQAEASPAQLEELRRFFGLDRPIHVQYLDWITHIARGDWGHSLRNELPILPLVLARLPLTYELAFLALVIALAIGVPAGIIAGLKSDTLIDGLVRLAALMGLAVPHFLLATLLILIFSRYLGWLPPVGFVGAFVDPARNLQGLILPAVALSMGVAADVMRMLRASIVEVYHEDYIRTARSKGVGERHVAVRHALRNALIAVVTLVAIRVGYLLAGAVIVEEIFSLPGMGRLLLNAVLQRDYPVVQACVMVVATTFVLVNLFADILYAYLDPRIRYA